MLDDEGKNLVLRKIGGDLEEELTVLKGNMRRLGYVSEVNPSSPSSCSTMWARNSLSRS